jgi:biotin carboxyl carrier protein
MERQDFVKYKVTLSGREQEVSLPKALIANIRGGNVETLNSLKYWKNRNRGVHNTTSDSSKLRIKTAATLIQLYVSNHDLVKRGALIAVIESMKMEQNIYAPLDGKIASLTANIGDFLQTGEILCEMICAG